MDNRVPKTKCCITGNLERTYIMIERIKINKTSLITCVNKLTSELLIKWQHSFLCNNLELIKSKVERSYNACQKRGVAILQVGFVLWKPGKAPAVWASYWSECGFTFLRSENIINNKWIPVLLRVWNILILFLKATSYQRSLMSLMVSSFDIQHDLHTFCWFCCSKVYITFCLTCSCISKG